MACDGLWKALSPSDVIRSVLGTIEVRMILAHCPYLFCASKRSLVGFWDGNSYIGCLFTILPLKFGAHL